MKTSLIFLFPALFGSFAAVSAVEDEGTPGSASATTTIPGDQLPAPDPSFGGEIKNDALSSKTWWAPRVVPPKQAPNVLLIITDDAGFGVPSTFGGVIPTPTMDRIAKNGLKYNNIHSTGVNDADYKPPFTFTGELNKLTLNVNRPKLSEDDIKKLEDAMKGADDSK